MEKPVFRDDDSLRDYYNQLGDEGRIKSLTWEVFRKYGNNVEHCIKFDLLASTAKDNLISLASEIAEKSDSMDVNEVVKNLIELSKSTKSPLIRLLDYDKSSLQSMITGISDITMGDYQEAEPIGDIEDFNGSNIINSGSDFEE